MTLQQEFVRVPAPISAPLADIERAIHRVLASGIAEWGAEVPAFEAELAQWIGVRYVVGTNSGAASLRLALQALGIGPGDEVISVPNSDLATTGAIYQVGATCVWVDIEPDTFNMDPKLVEQAITPRTKALLPVDLYGHPADMPALNEIARRHNLFVIQDSCLSLGSTIQGQPTGTWADITCFSHAPSKHLGAFGSAGSVATNDPELAEKMQLYSGYGQTRSRSNHYRLAGVEQILLVEGRNERLDELQAAILRTKLPYVATWIEMRRANAQAYTDALQGSAIRLPVERPGYRHVYRNYVIQVPERARVQGELAEAGISTKLLYVPPLHLQPAYEALGNGRGSFPVTEAASDALMSIPVGPEVTLEQREHIIATLLRTCNA